MSCMATGRPPCPVPVHTDIEGNPVRQAGAANAAGTQAHRVPRLCMSVMQGIAASPSGRQPAGVAPGRVAGHAKRMLACLTRPNPPRAAPEAASRSARAADRLKRPNRATDVPMTSVIRAAGFSQAGQGRYCVTVKSIAQSDDVGSSVAVTRVIGRWGLTPQAIAAPDWGTLA
jgi:hypothetical protein